MSCKRKTNYEVHKDLIIMEVSENSSCYNCQARSVCNSLCKERGIDTAKRTPPCFEAWLKWADMEAK